MDLKKQLLATLTEANEARIYNLDHSIALAEQVLAASQQSDLIAVRAKALSQLSLYHMIIGDNDAAMGFAQDSMSLYEELEDEKGIADAKYSIAGVYYKTDNYHIGLVFLIDALNIYKKGNDYYNISRCEKSLGTVYEYSDDQKSAVQAYENAIEAAKQINDLNLESNAYNNLSGVYIKQQQVDLAASVIEKSIALKQQTGDVRGMAFAKYGRAKVLMALEKYEASETEFKASKAIHLEMGERLGLAMCHHKMGKLYLAMNRLEDAKNEIYEGLTLTKQYNISIIKFKCYYLLYLIFKQEQNETMALEYLEHYLKEKEHVLNTQTLKVIDSYDMLVQMKTMQKEAELQREKAELIEKNNRAEEAARVRQEFLSTMSHEIRTPLNAITTIVSMLSERSNDEDKKLIHSLKFSSNLLMWIINDILDFTKLDLGKMMLEPNPVQLEPLMQNLRKSYKYQASEKGLQFRLRSNIPSDSCYLIDQTRLTQILGNLISNAIKFTASGQVELVVDIVRKGKINDKVLFQVIDTGEGIESKDLTKIFESFSQIKNTITRKEGGTGLGLAIVKNLVRLHNSDIVVASEAGKGTTFSFVLKLKKSTEFVESKKEVAHNNLENKTILLAEDNAINALIATRLLSQWGIVTTHAKNGVEAVKMAQSQPFDFILMDIHMPEMDGFEATAQIRTGDSVNRNQPIFALTADISAKDNTSHHDYFDGFLLKPLEIEKLHRALTIGIV